MTKREHLDGIAAVLDAAGALSRLTVRSVPNAAHCEHASCRRRRGEPPAPRMVRSRLDHRPSGVDFGPLLSLAEVMEQHPQLNTFGIGVFAPSARQPDSVWPNSLADARSWPSGRP